MNRLVVAGTAVAAALLVTGTAALALSLDDNDSRRGIGMHQRMDPSWTGDDRGPGPWMGPGSWRHGRAAVMSERRFLQDMIGPHMTAVMMSQQLLARGLADVETLAGSIRDEQHDEILQMQCWLAEWFGQGRSGWCGGLGMPMGPWSR